MAANAALQKEIVHLENVVQQMQSEATNAQADYTKAAHEITHLESVVEKLHRQLRELDLNHEALKVNVQQNHEVATLLTPCFLDWSARKGAEVGERPGTGESRAK